MAQDQQQAFEQVKAFAAKSEYFGIPADIFYAVIGISVAIGATLRSIVLIMVYLVVLGVPMYRIHQSDPFALKVWIRAMKQRHDRWGAGISTPRELIIINKDASK